MAGARLAGLPEGSSFDLVVVPPYGRNSYEQRLTLVDGAGVVRGDGQPAESYAVKISNPQFNEAFYDLNGHGEIVRHMAASWFEVLADERGNESAHEHLQWLSLKSQQLPLGHADPLSILGFIPLHLGFVDASYALGSWTIRQRVISNSPLVLNETIQKNGLPVMTAKLSYGAMWLPLEIQAVPLEQFVPAGQPAGGAWSIHLSAAKLGSGAMQTFGNGPAPSDMPAPRSSSLKLSAGPIPGTTVLSPDLTTTLVPHFQGASALDSALREPSVLLSFSSAPNQFVCGYTWERNRFLLTDGAGNPVDPTGTLTNQHQFGFTPFPLVEGFVVGTGSVVQEQRIAGQDMVQPVAEGSDSISATCPGIVNGPSLPRDVKLASLDAGVRLFASVAGSERTLDSVRWMSVELGSNPVIYWVLQTGCRPDTVGNATTVLVNAFTGFLEYAFAKKAGRGLGGCGLGALPPIT